jgi:glucosyl-3-phosphoglycerate synthase
VEGGVMFNFSQKHTKITTLYLLGQKTDDLGPKLRQKSRGKRPVLVVPTLATEFTLPENRPVFLNIIKQLSRITYLYKIIFGLDGASSSESLDLARILKSADIKNYIIQHNDGKNFKGLYKRLGEAGFKADQPGKGRNMFMSFGIAQALDSQYIGVLDADIRTFHRRQLDRLFYPVIALDHEFSKAFYSRISDGRMYGRVKRLLLDPLLMALKRKFSETGEDKFLRIIDYLLSFNYQLSGEVIFDTSLLKRMHFATNWGVEVFTLIEVYRKANNVAQVQFSTRPFDHKHQIVSEEEIDKGLYKMAMDVVTTILSTLVVEEGLEISDYFVQDLTATYLSVADELIKKYAANSAFCDLSYDRNAEEEIVRGVFKDAILTAGDFFTSPYRITDRFLRVLLSDKRFHKYLDQGLDNDLLAYEKENQSQLFEIPQTVSWERVIMKIPGILDEIKEVVNSEKTRYARA